MRVFDTPDRRVPLRSVASLAHAGRFSLGIDRRSDLEEAATAQRAVMEDSVFGTLVLDP